MLSKSRLSHHDSWIDLHRLRALLIIFFLTSSTVLYSQTTVYVNPSTGSDTNAGTIDAPFKTIAHGLRAIGSGGIVYLRGGTYSYTGSSSNYISLNTAATKANPIRLWAYGDEKPVIDFHGSSAGQALLLYTNAQYNHLKGLEVKNCPGYGIEIYGKNNIIENCSFHNNGYGTDSAGTMIDGGCTGVQAHGDSLLMLNCDSYDNEDLPAGENSNGFVVSGKGVVLKGCRAWHNSDDGFDFWYSVDRIVVDNCYAYRNGTGITGNGMGFKLGGSTINQSDTSRAWHLLRHCVSFDNRGKGYDQNGNPRGTTFYNCTGFRNGGGGFNMDFPSTDPDTVYNCISYLNTNTNVAFEDRSVLVTNSWQIATVTADDFVSLDTSGITGTRNADGSLPTSSFLRLAAGSDLIDTGTNVGLPYLGSAPDLGAFEATAPPVVRLSAEVLDFGHVFVNHTRALPVSITNSGTYTLRVTNIASPNSMFSVSATKFDLTPGASSTDSIRATASATPGIVDGVVIIASNSATGLDTIAVKLHVVLMVTGVDPDAAPTAFALGQNYPNPFNPSTTIRYGLPHKSAVQLTVFNTLGQQVAVLQNGEEEAGYHELKFDGTGLSSGVYFYRIQAGEFVETRRLVLLK